MRQATASPEEKLAELLGDRDYGPRPVPGGTALPRRIAAENQSTNVTPLRPPQVMVSPAATITETDTAGASVRDAGIVGSDAPVALGEAEAGMATGAGLVGIDLAGLLDGRLLVQGTSGAGKSWTLRRILEQTHGRIQQVVIDPEGEFGALAERFGHLNVDAEQLDIGALGVLGARVREHRLSIIVDISGIERDRQMLAVAAVLEAMIGAPREHWHPALVAIDEAHLFAPHGGVHGQPAVRRAAIAAVTDLMSRGRKRGLIGILATQRLARLAKAVASEVHNFLIGLNTLDLDIRRAAETIGWDARKGFDRLPMLEPGDFVAVGPAFSRSPAVLRVGPVETRHTGASPAIAAPASVAADDAARLVDLDGLLEASAGESDLREEADMALQQRAVRAFIREPGFAVAGPVCAALAPLAPAGARVEDLHRHLDINRDSLAAGLELLDRYGVVEFTGEGADRAVRLVRHMLPGDTGQGGEP